MLRGTPLATIVAVKVALFSDAFLYGMIIPLTASSAAAPEDQLGLAISYGAYGLGVLLATPVLASLVEALLALLLSFNVLAFAGVDDQGELMIVMAVVNAGVGLYVAIVTRDDVVPGGQTCR